MNKDCEKLLGPCTCGAWHTPNDVSALKNKEKAAHQENALKQIVDLEEFKKRIKELRKRLK